jgi:hypothetical protein
MRIGFITGEYPPMQGGVGAFTRELAREMVRQGHDVEVLTRETVQGASDEIKERWQEVGLEYAARCGRMGAPR